LILELHMDADSCSRRLIGALERKGLNVLLGTQELPDGASDEQQLQFAVSLGRPIVTANLVDFARINDEWSAAGRVHHGIIIWFQRFRSPEIVAELIADLCRRSTAESTRNMVFFV
jgi:hypothetical protein